MKTMFRRLSLVLMMMCAGGCATTTVEVQPTGVVKAGPDVMGHVYVKTGGKWFLSKNPVHIPQGWYMHDCSDCE